MAACWRPEKLPSKARAACLLAIRASQRPIWVRPLIMRRHPRNRSFQSTGLVQPAGRPDNVSTASEARIPVTNLAVPALNPALLDQATKLLLAPAALEFRHLSQVLADIHVHHVDYADLYFQYSRLESWSLEEGIVKSGAYSIDRGVGVRAVSGEKTAFAYSDDISLDALAQAAMATRAIGRQGQSAVAALDHVGGARFLYPARGPGVALSDGDK